MRKKYWIHFTMIVCLLAGSSIRAEDKSPVEKMQSSRTETIDSIEAFLVKISPLEKNIQEKLLNARLVNATQVFKRGAPFDEPWISDFFVRTLTTGKDLWSLSSVRYHTEYLERDDDHPYDRSQNFRLELIVNFVPNTALLEWKRTLDEYVEYSKEEIRSRDATVDVSGTIESLMWKKEIGGDFHTTEKLSSNDDTMIRYTLTEKLKSYSVDSITATETDASYRYPLATHVKFLRGKIAEWVKYYMGKGQKPKPIRDTTTS